MSLGKNAVRFVLSLLGSTALVAPSICAYGQTYSTTDLDKILAAISVPAGTSASYSGDPKAIGYSTISLAHFPPSGKTFGILSSGIVSQITMPNTSGSQGTDLGSTGTDGDSATLTFTIPLPQTPQKPAAIGFNFTFLSEEYPEWVGSQYNDSFSAYLNGVNIARDPTGKPITVNNNYFNAGLIPVGTFFDGQTPPIAVRAALPATGTSASLVLNVKDAGDGVYDSAAFIANVKLFYSQRVFIDFGEDKATIPIPFNPSYTKPAANLTAIQQEEIVTEVQKIYAPYLVDVTSARPDSGDYTTIYVGGTTADLPLLARFFFPDNVLGKAQSIDIGDANRADSALIFSGNSWFGSGDSTNLDYLSQVIAHETGHLLGLFHELPDTELMYPYAGGLNRIGLSDSDTKRAEIKSNTVTIVGDLTQNPYLELVRNVGLRDGSLLIGEQSLADKVLKNIKVFFGSLNSTVYGAQLAVELSDDALPTFYSLGDIVSGQEISLNIPFTDFQGYIFGSSVAGGVTDIYGTSNGLTSVNPADITLADVLAPLDVSQLFDLFYGAGDGFTSLGSVNFALNQATNEVNWLADPTNSSFADLNNWQNGLLPSPNSTAIFSATSHPEILLNGNIEVAAFHFAVDAPAYTFAVTGSASGPATLTLSGLGIENNSAYRPTFSISGIEGSLGTLQFSGNAGAGDALITAGDFGVVLFTGNSSAGTAGLTANGGGKIDLSGTSGTAGNHKINAGSIAGSGTYYLGSNTLTVGISNTSTEVSGVIADGGASGGTGAVLIKVGSGTLILSGPNTYTGGTIINAGTIAISADDNLGGGALTMANNTALAITASGTYSHNVFLAGDPTFFVSTGTIVEWSGIIADSGSAGDLELVGGGALVLSATNTYTGITDITAGTLALSGSGGIAASTSVVVGGVFDVSATTSGASITALYGSGSVALGAKTLTITNASSIFSGVIDGTGRLAVAGGIQAMTGINTYSGGTTITGGALQIGNGGTTGSITGNVANNGIIAFNRSDNITFAGIVSGTGGVIKLGAGTTTLTGANTYSGGTTISAGTLQIGNGGTAGAIVGNVVNNSILAFNRSDAVAFGGVISGTGAVRQLGNGTTTLTATNTYTGNTTVNAGTLVVTGSIASSSLTTVSSGAKLAGTGTVGSLAFNTGSMVAPGVSGVGTLRATGAVTFASGSTYAADLTPTAADRLAVTGSAILGGATVAVTDGGGTYLAGSKYQLLSSTSGTGGSFTLTTAGSFLGVNGKPTLAPKLTYDGTSVYLELALAHLTPNLPDGAPRNAFAVTGAIDNAIARGDTLPTAFTNLGNLLSPALVGATAQISGEVGADTAQAGQATLNPFFTTVLDRFGDMSLSLPETSSASASQTPQIALGERGVLATSASPRSVASVGDTGHVWATIVGGRMDANGDAVVVGSHNVGTRTAAIMGGFDLLLAPNALIGIAASGGQADLKLGGGLGSGHSSVFQLGGYGTARFADGIYVSAMGAYAWHHLTTNRLVTVAGNDVLAAKFWGENYGGRIEGGYRLGTAPVDVTPYVALQVDAFKTPAYQETAASGASTFALSYQANKTTSVRTELGASLDHSLTLGEDTPLHLMGKAAWVYSDSDSPAAKASFEALAGSEFTVYGVKNVRDAARLSLGARVGDTEHLSFTAKVDSLISSRSTSYFGTATLDIRW